MAILTIDKEVHLLWIVLFFGVFYVSGVCVYNGFLHPLAKIRGPWLARLTNGYAAFHAYKEDIHLNILHCHQKYGSRIRYGPKKIIFNTAEAYHDIYSAGKNVAKAKGYEAFRQESGDNSILSAIDKKEHGRKKRIMVHGFSDAALRRYEPCILDFTASFLDLVAGGDSTGTATEEEQWSKPLNMAKWTNYLSMDIMGKLVFSTDLRTLTDPKYRFLISTIETTMFQNGIIGQAAEMMRWGLERFSFPGAERGKQRFRAAAREIAGQRIKTASQKEFKLDDVFQNLLDAKDPETGQEMGVGELAAESGVLIVAGSDTVALTLSSLFFHLSRNPAIYAAATHEIRSTFSSSSEIIAGPSLKSCVYLRACLDEALRLAPPLAGPLWRTVQPGGAVIDGEPIPAGTDVGVAIYALHHNGAYFADPYAFAPERWLAPDDDAADEDEDRARTAERARRAYVPFSVGPRNCLGKHLALMEVSLVMAHVLWAVDFRAAVGRVAKKPHAKPVAKPAGDSSNLGASGECVVEGDEGTSIPGRDGEEEEGSELGLRAHFTAATDGPMIQFRRRAPN